MPKYVADDGDFIRKRMAEIEKEKTERVGGEPEEQPTYMGQEINHLDWNIGNVGSVQIDSNQQLNQINTGFKSTSIPYGSYRVVGQGAREFFDGNNWMTEEQWQDKVGDIVILNNQSYCIKFSKLPFRFL